MRSLRARLFAVTLAALALTLALTVAIGAALTRRQVDRAQAAALAQVANVRALDRRRHVSYSKGDQQLGSLRIMVQSRSAFAGIVPNVNRSSDGRTEVGGKRQLYAYRTLPRRGLLILRP